MERSIQQTGGGGLRGGKPGFHLPSLLSPFPSVKLCVFCEIWGFGVLCVLVVNPPILFLGNITSLFPMLKCQHECCIVLFETEAACRAVVQRRRMHIALTYFGRCHGKEGLISSYLCSLAVHSRYKTPFLPNEPIIFSLIFKSNKHESNDLHKLPFKKSPAKTNPIYWLFSISPLFLGSFVVHNLLCPLRLKPKIFRVFRLFRGSHPPNLFLGNITPSLFLLKSHHEQCSSMFL
jgi:hypothetical protein